MLARIASAIDTFNSFFGKAANILALLLVLLVALDVALRYFFHISYVAVREIEVHVYALLFLLGAAATLRHDAHVRVDVLYQHFGARGRAIVNMVGTLIFLVPGCWLVIKTSLPFVEYSYNINEVSPDPGGLTHRWVLKAFIPLAFSLLTLQGVSFFIKNLLVFLGRPVQEDS